MHKGPGGAFVKVNGDITILLLQRFVVEKEERKLVIRRESS